MDINLSSSGSQKNENSRKIEAQQSLRKAETANCSAEASAELDVLENSPASKISKVAEAKKPLLPEADPSSNRLDLFKLLSEETRQLLESLLSSSKSGAVNSKQFLDMLAKMIPLSMTLIQGNGKSDVDTPQNLSETLASMVNEMEAILQKHSDSSTLSIESKSLLQNLANQLKTIEVNRFEPMIKELIVLSGKTINTAEHQLLVKQLVEEQALPEKWLSEPQIPAKALKQALTLIQQETVNVTHPTVQTLVQMSRLFTTVQAFPIEQRAQVIQLMMRTQGLFSTTVSQGVLGPNTQQLTKDLSTFLISITQAIGVIPDNQEIADAGSQYLSRVLGELILTGAILGRMVIDKGDGKAMELNEALHIGQEQMRASRDLGIIDLVPFSFLAFFAPFEQMGGDKSKAKKEAMNALMKFIRTFMSLLFMLTAIYTGGKKIGNHGVELMLEANADYLRSCIANLIFCLKKLDELYGVNVTHPIQRCGRAKTALDQKNYDEFWDHIFGFFTEKGSLFHFLEEVGQLDPLYESIHALLKESGMEHLTLMRM